MNILAQLQADLLDHNMPLSAILRKAKVLASQLDSDELATWVDHELDGYKDEQDLPDYRRLDTAIAGTLTNNFQVVKNQVVPLYLIKDEYLQELATTFPVMYGIRTIEHLSKGLKNNQRFKLPSEFTILVNDYIKNRGSYYAELYYTIDTHNFEQILDDVRNRLLDFVLKLGKQWNPEIAPPAQHEVDRLVSITIFNVPQGGSMSVFDQRGQQVQYQFNAAGNINIDTLQFPNQLSDEIAKLRAEIDQARNLGVIPEDTAVEAQYHLLEASREAASEKPDRSTLLERIGRARDLLKDIAAVAGLVSALVKLAEIVPRLIP